MRHRSRTLETRGRRKIGEIVRRSIQQGSPAFGSQEAIEEGGNFRISKERIEGDEKFINNHGGMEGAATAKHLGKWEETNE